MRSREYDKNLPYRVRAYVLQSLYDEMIDHIPNVLCDEENDYIPKYRRHSTEASLDDSMKYRIVTLARTHIYIVKD